MEENLFAGQELSDEEKVVNLESLCDATETITFDRAYTPQVLAEKRESISSQMMDIDDREEELKLLMAELRRDVTDKKKQLKVTLRQLKARFETVTEKTYKVADQEERKMRFYDAQGILIMQRPLRPEERQLTISRPMAVNE